MINQKWKFNSYGYIYSRLNTIQKLYLYLEETSKLSMGSIIDELKGEHVNYMHSWMVSKGIIKKVVDNKIYIQDGYKLRRLDVRKTVIDHQAIIGYIIFNVNENSDYVSELKLNLLAEENPF